MLKIDVTILKSRHAGIPGPSNQASIFSAGIPEVNKPATKCFLRQTHPTFHTIKYTSQLKTRIFCWIPFLQPARLLSSMNTSGERLPRP